MLPTLVAAGYFFGIASPQYVSHADFVVRGQGTEGAGVLTSFLQTATGGGGGLENTYAVQDFMMSRDAAVDLSRSVDLRSVFDRHGTDALSRYPAPWSRADGEHFYEYYRRHVVAELDTTTGISTLAVRTFRPGDSQRIAVALMGAAEHLVNQMNERQRQNTISAASNELANAEAKLRQLGVRLAAYRNREALLDPNKQSVPMLKEISDLEAELTATRIQVAQLQASAPNSPLIPVYQRRMTALEAQIAESNLGITGPSTSLVPKLTAFDDLTIQQELAEKELAADATALAAARAQADRQLLYLDEVVRPNLPDYPEYPRSLASVAVVFAGLVAIYLMARLLIAGAREHQLV